jgi:hypothetical protein
MSILPVPSPFPGNYWPSHPPASPPWLPLVPPCPIISPDHRKATTPWGTCQPFHSAEKQVVARFLLIPQALTAHFSKFPSTVALLWPPWGEAALADFT